MNKPQVRYLSSPTLFQEKENLYVKVRRREGRVLSDEVVKRLPFISSSSPYAREWKWRERSLNRFRNQLPESSKLSGSSKLRILDLGCGNGWMANRLAENPNWEVWGVDLNQVELEQAARLFGRENLTFAYADLVPMKATPGVLHETLFQGMGAFDIILLAASVQYFPNLEVLLLALRKLLGPDGEVHILDSPFYKNETDRAAARRRTSAYYTEIGVPEMAGFYHHHLWPEAKTLGAENLNAGLKAKLLQRAKWLAPFPWLRFRNLK